MNAEKSCFKDGKRRADYVIVTDKAESFPLEQFLEKLSAKGLDYEINSGKVKFV